MKRPFPNVKKTGPDAGSSPCCICGREDATTHKIRVVDGGCSIVVGEEDIRMADPGGDLGDLPVGSGCVRKWKLQPFLVTYPGIP